MNREIKFRAWDGEKMYYSYLMAGEEWTNPIAVAWNEEYVKKYLRKREWKLMQWIGLKDKNGKEIYEGDIVKYYYKISHWDDEGDETETVEYNDHFAGFSPFCNQYEQRDTYFEIVKVEIIGNIYENPELTK